MARLTDTDPFTWTVTNTNQAPVFSTDLLDQSDAEGDVVSLDADATDADLDGLTYSATGLPAGVSINPSTGVISGTLSATSSGTHNVVVTVSDGTLTDTDSFSWTVTEPVVNQAPVFSTDFGNRTDAEGAVISLDANATDPDGNPLTYSATGLPAGITINPTTGVISGTLSATSSGTYSTVITVSDGTLSDTDPFSWTVTEPLIMYANDTFTRTTTNSWGSALTGGAYSLQSTAADYDVTGSVGTMLLPSAGATRQATLNTVAAQDVDLSFRFATDKVPTGTSQYIYAVARRINATTAYWIKVRLAPGGAVYLHASVYNTSETAIGSEIRVTGLTHVAGGFLRLRAQLEGASPTTIRARAWADGATEPITWQYSATNNQAVLQAAGGVGFRAYIGNATTNAPVLVTFDDYLCTSIGGP